MVLAGEAIGSNDVATIGVSYIGCGSAAIDGPTEKACRGKDPFFRKTNA